MLVAPPPPLVMLQHQGDSHGTIWLNLKTQLHDWPLAQRLPCAKITPWVNTALFLAIFVGSQSCRPPHGQTSFFFPFKHWLMNTTWANGESSLVIAQGAGQGMSCSSSRQCSAPESTPLDWQWPGIHVQSGRSMGYQSPLAKLSEVVVWHS